MVTAGAWNPQPARTDVAAMTMPAIARRWITLCSSTSVDRDRGRTPGVRPRQRGQPTDRVQRPVGPRRTRRAVTSGEVRASAHHERDDQDADRGDHGPEGEAPRLRPPDRERQGERDADVDDRRPPTVSGLAPAAFSTCSAASATNPPATTVERPARSAAAVRAPRSSRPRPRRRRCSRNAPPRRTRPRR